MKIAQVIRAYDLIAEREALTEHMCRKYSGLAIMDRHCDAKMMEALAVPYAAGLRHHLTAIEQELIGMGVDLNSPHPAALAAAARPSVAT